VPDRRRFHPTPGSTFAQFRHTVQPSTTRRGVGLADRRRGYASAVDTTLIVILVLVVVVLLALGAWWLRSRRRGGVIAAPPPGGRGNRTDGGAR
jgi:hypothetical protein